MSRLRRAALLGGAAALLLLAGARPALASGFGDLAAYAWAMPGVAVLQGEGVLDGVSAGSFGPSSLLTRAEMAAILGRFLGWPAGATATGPSFADAAAIPAYALPYVETAAAKGILQGLPDGTFQPQGSLSWPELAAIVARALAYPAVAAGQVPSQLGRLPQGASTPAWAQQAVAQDVQAGDFGGVLADLYQPAQDVTRAELAAFLAQAQAGAAGGTVGAGTVLSGQLTAVSGLQATVQAVQGSESVAIGPSAVVYDGTAPGSPTDLQAGETVTLVTLGNQATGADITAGPAVAAPVGLTAGLTGTLAWSTGTEMGLARPGVPTVDGPLASGASLTLPGAGQAVAVTLNGAGQAVAVDTAGTTAASATTLTGTVVSLAGGTLVLDIAGTDETFSLPSSLAGGGQLAAGAGVTLTVAVPGGEVTALTVDNPAPPQSVTGVIVSTAGSALGLDVSGTDQTYLLTPTTTINGTLDVGQTATVTLSGGQVTAVEVSASGTVTGVVASYVGDTVVLDVAGTDQTYTLTPTTTITGTLAAGDTATLTLSGGQVTAVEVSASGTVTGVVASNVGDSLVLDVSGADQTYTLTPATTITGTLAAGGTATLTLNGGQVIAVAAASAGSGTSATGVVEALAGNNLILDVGNAPEIFSVTPATTVDGVTGNLSTLTPGTAVTLSLSNGEVTAIQVQTTAGTSVTGQVLSLGNDTLSLDVAGAGATYTLTPTTTVNGQLNNLSAVFIGQTVTVTASGTVVTAIATSTAGGVTGEVAAVSGDSLVLDVSGVDEAFTLSASTTVDGALNDLGALAAGQTVTLFASSGDVTAVQITAGSGSSGVVAVVESVSGDTLVVAVGGVTQAYTLTASTTVNGAAGDFAALAPGTTVTLYLSGGQVTAVATGGGTATTTVTGVVATISGYALILDVGGTSEAYTLTASTTVDGTANGLGAIADGDMVTLTLTNGAVTAVQTQSLPG